MSMGDRTRIDFGRWTVGVGARVSGLHHDVFEATVIEGPDPGIELVVKQTRVDPDDAKRGAREARAYAKLRDLTGSERSRSRIVACLASIRDETTYSFLLERLGSSVTAVAAGTLDDTARRELIETVLCDVHHALDILRQRGFAHRDVHPGNVLVPLDDRPDTAPEQVTLIDFSHAYHQGDPDMPSSGSLPGSRVVQSPDMLVRMSAHRGFVDDVYALGMTAHILLDSTLPTAWTIDDRRVPYAQRSPDFAPFLPRASRWPDPLPEGYRLVPDTVLIRRVLGDGPDDHAAHAIMAMLESDGTAREELLPMIEAHIQLLRESRRGPGIEPPTGRYDGVVLGDFVEDDEESDVLFSDVVEPHGAAGRPEPGPPTVASGDDPSWAPWLAAPEYYAPHSDTARSSRRSDSPPRRRRRRSSFSPRARKAASWAIVVIPPLLVFAAAVFAPVVGLAALDVQRPADWVVWSILILGLMITLFVSLTAQEDAKLLAPFLRSLAASLVGALLFVYVPTLFVNGVSAVVYAYLPGIPWRVSEWTVPEALLVLLLAAAVVAVLVAIIGRVTKGIPRNVTRATTAMAVIALVAVVTIPALMAFPPWEATARSSAVDCGTTAVPFLRGGTDRMCLPAVEGWRSMSDEEFVADPTAVAGGFTTVSSGGGSVMALRSLAQPCLSALVYGYDVGGAVPVRAEVERATAPDQPKVLLTRISTDGTVDRVRFGATDYTVFRPVDGNDESMMMYVAYSVPPFRNLAADPPGLFGTTGALVQFVERDCAADVETHESLDVVRAALLSVLRVSDTGNLSRSYLSVDSAALQGLGLTGDSIEIPVGGGLSPARVDDIDGIRTNGQGFAAAVLAFSTGDDAPTATIVFSTTKPAGMEAATTGPGGWTVSKAQSDATLDETYYRETDVGGTSVYISMRVYAGPQVPFGSDASDAVARLLTGIDLSSAKVD
ncbi:hypothetical protein GCM10010988_17300 [Cnuibacter physcomitrellae]|nr:hypothetical protein [Cnuibacter physcomitrellae]GGI38102.1 hypothetical protein GCM10010988_17300 [Cnuibacter physcomitrellae]